MFGASPADFLPVGGVQLSVEQLARSSLGRELAGLYVRVVALVREISPTQVRHWAEQPTASAMPADPPFSSGLHALHQ